MHVLVVGAGHNGLVAAIGLAAHGLDVTVLEHAPRPGGATTSTEATLPGFVHDHCAGFVPMTLASPAMRELELDVEWVNPPVVLAHPVRRRQRDRAASRPRGDGGVARTRRAGLGGGDGAAAADLDPADRGDRRAAAARAPGRRGSRSRCGATGWNGRGGSPARSRRSGSTCSRATGARPRGWRARPSTPGCRRRPRAVARSGCCCRSSATATAGRLPRGGMQVLADALIRRARTRGCADPLRRARRARAGARRPRRRRAARERRRGRGPRRSSARSARACSARLLPDGALPGRLHRRLRIWRYGTAPFKLDYALSGPVPLDRSRGALGGGRAHRRRARRADPRRRRVAPRRRP